MARPTSSCAASVAGERDGRRRRERQRAHERHQAPARVVVQHVAEGRHRRAPDALGGRGVEFGVGPLRHRRQVGEARHRRAERRGELAVAIARDAVAARALRDEDSAPLCEARVALVQGPHVADGVPALLRREDVAPRRHPPTRLPTDTTCMKSSGVSPVMNSRSAKSAGFFASVAALGRPRVPSRRDR
jgi:hypothetical protein